ncbi:MULTISPECIES: ATP-grasp domain-containing protein [Streptomyces]|uniref:Biotin carboxylase n=1 Tax=Streptomyces stelliscabiei TaxID=146820 RepID=A0A8I0TP24_9ACTN|nr:MULTISPECIES: ATP-grasp domain-containing protein [Streptomyces]KND46431.1 carboxylate--amine ligase [Streptomyces stelliscabiei]MBE1595144.1 biotin carboxylase [Streptomyces stelliscabiei]MDX2516109.1 ATP-grasp domain-containing protein [Streptomyces stelliscabiei]MDX2553081.1 ATP-grasp domain-containing protein [Streptomyces stelliscabiei]MDX2612069.1 ATP-grasp domain-containing protein [Streptomyces stelliscabiei]
MAHLLVVESWVGSMSRLLPRAIREGGHEFTFLTRDLHHYLRSAPEGTAHPLLGARNVVTADTNDLDALLPEAARLHAVFGFDGVISSCDYYLPTVARIAGHLGLPGPDPRAVADACRKDATRRVLADADVPGPRFALHEEWGDLARAAREIGYPLVVKPVDLCAGMYVRRVDDESELAAAVAALADFPLNARGQRRVPAVLLEELLTGPEVSVETVSHAGAVHVVGVTDKSVGGAPAFIETGHMFPAALTGADAEAAEQTALNALKALGLTDGVVAHTEIKLTPAGPRVVEVNPRPAGNRITELIRHVTGIDLAAAAVEVALGRAPDLRRRETGLRSAAVGFLVPDTSGTLEALDGGPLADRAGVLEVRLAEPGRQVRSAGSNNEYLGHVMVGDPAGSGARDQVEALLAELRDGLVIR